MNNEEAAKRLFALVDQKYVEQKDFAAELGITPSIISEWRRGKSTSFAKLKYVSRIAEILGTTTEYILTGETAARPQEGDELIDAIQGLTDEERRKVAEYVALLEAARRKR